MAPRGRKRKTGLRREDAARDRMKELGFEKCVIDNSIKQIVKVYGEDQWFLIEDANYAALLSVCLEKQEEQANQLNAEEQTKQVAAEEQTKQLAAEEQANQLAAEEQTNQLAAEEQTKQTGQDKQEDEKEAGKAVMDSANYAHCSVGGAESSHFGWLSSEDEETDSSDEDYVLVPLQR